MKPMFYWIPLMSLMVLAGCSPATPTDAELRLAAKSELRKRGRPEAEQNGLEHHPISNLQCAPSRQATRCSFSIGGTNFSQHFARTGSGGWSAYDR